MMRSIRSLCFSLSYPALSIGWQNVDKRRALFDKAIAYSSPSKYPKLPYQYTTMILGVQSESSRGYFKFGVVFGLIFLLQKENSEDSDS